MTSLARTRVFPGPSPLAARLAALLLAAAPLVVVGPLVPAAHAAPQASVPVALPSGQKADEWADALASRGLVVSRVAGLPASGPGVSLVDHKDYWEMTVRDWKGGTQTVNVAPCATPEEREDLLFYASTLLGPAPAPVEPAVATVAPVVVPPPAVTPAPPPTVTPTPAPPTASAPPATALPTASSTGAKAPPREPATASSTGAKAPPREATTQGASGTAVPAEPRRAETVASAPATSTTTTPKRAPDTGPGPWVAVGGGVGIRSAAGAVADFHADGGWYLTRDVRVGLGLGARSAAALLEAGDGRTMGNVDLLVEGAWGLPLAPVTPYLGVYTGVGIRSFADAGEPVLSAPVPLIGGEVGVNVPLGQLPLQIAPVVRVQGDMRSIELRTDGGLTPVSPVEIRAGLALVYRPK